MITNLNNSNIIYAPSIPIEILFPNLAVINWNIDPIITNSSNGFLSPPVYKEFSLLNALEVLYPYYKREYGINSADFYKSAINSVHKTSANAGKETVKKFLTDPIEHSGVLRDSGFSYRFDEGKFILFLPHKGTWKSNDDGYIGNDPYNLGQCKLNLQSAEVFRIIAKNHGINLDARNVLQTNQLDSCCWIQNPEPYMKIRPVYDNLSELFNKWPPGKPISSYSVVNRSGYSFDVHEFFYSGQKILLCSTIQQHKINMQFFLSRELVSPTYENIILNRDLLESLPGKPLLLFNDFGMAKHFRSEKFISSCLGDYAVLKNSELNALDGRESISYAVDLSSTESLAYAAELISKTSHKKSYVKLIAFGESNPFRLKMNYGVEEMELSASEFQNVRMDCVQSLINGQYRELSHSDFYEIVSRIPELNYLKMDRIAELALTSVKDLDEKAPTFKSIIYPLCKPETLLYLHGDSQVNSSMLCLDFSIMIALAEIYGSGRFYAPSSVKVLYVDSGMGLVTLKERISLLRSLYKNNNLNKDNPTTQFN